MPERQFGPYRLVRQVAVGGMAEIHLAKTKGIAGFEKYVALKMIHPNFAEDDAFIQMLVDEAKIAVQLTHGNIAQTFDLGRVGDTYYITMEYVDGADLYKVLRRASERDLEMPLDVCAFIGKEVTSALDHAHRKRDHAGKPLGIVHRDVSPQNVLLSYAGEVKLVDFGIAKATMKVRQTAAGVIKGKYYYMSPEQAWGDSIDHRSDIFSAGIVLYELITGQMLYLEEDLHKLLDMARRADIAPPSRLRRGVPPQLERIVMHALAKAPADRYQNAGDFATDLERFLHAYSPVFTASKIAGLLREVVGEPAGIPDEQSQPSIEIRGGPLATNVLDQSQLIVSGDEIRDENSVIFRVEDLKPAPAPAARAPLRAPGTRPPPMGKIPSIRAPALPAVAPAPRVARKLHEDTRQLDAAPSDGRDDTSGLLTPAGQKVSRAVWDQTATHDTNPGEGDDLETGGERTMITAPGMAGFLADHLESNDGDGATLISSIPQPDPGTDVEGRTAPEDGAFHDDHAPDSDDDEGPTMSRDFTTQPRPTSRRATPPAALAAKIHAPAVSELRKPRASKRTPYAGVPTPPNVLQQIVGSQASEPMPTPRPVVPARPRAATQPPPLPPAAMPLIAPQTPLPQPAPPLYPAQPYPPLPLADTPHASQLQQAGIPPHMQPYLHVQGMPPSYPPPGYPGYPQHPPQQPVYPGQLYPFTPQAGQQALSLTGQLRLSEVDEMPSHYKLGPSKSWLKYVVAGTLAIAVAAGSTALIMSSAEPDRPTVGSVRIESVPLGADIIFDGNRLSQKTPYTVADVAIGKAYEVRIELPKHKAHVESIELAPTGAELRVLALLKLNTGTLVVSSTPAGAEVRIDDQIRGRTPTTISEIDMAAAGRLELRLKDHEPFIQDLKWPESGTLEIDAKLRR